MAQDKECQERDDELVRVIKSVPCTFPMVLASGLLESIPSASKPQSKEPCLPSDDFYDDIIDIIDNMLAMLGDCDEDEPAGDLTTTDNVCSHDTIGTP